MKLFRTNEYISIDILNYLMFFTNIGFLLFFLHSITYTDSAFSELVYKTCTYYKFILPFCIYLLLYYFLSERKIKPNIINSNLQKIITKSNLIILALIMLCYIITLFLIITMVHNMDI